MGISRRQWLSGVGSLCTVGLVSGRAGATTRHRDHGSRDSGVETVASGLEVPWGVEFGPDGTLYFTERPGRVNRLRPDGSVDTLAEFPDTRAIGEGGLLGLALSPAFPASRAMYLYQTYEDDGIKNRIIRCHLEDGSLLRGDVIFDDIPGASTHDGGRLAFGPDGKLYVTCGDAQERTKAQDPQTLHGAILRLDPDGSVPADNPFGTAVFSYGHRNPEGLAFHPETGELYSTEHGPDTDDEVNLIQQGHNYGWPEVTGPSDDPRFTDPLVSYTPTIAPASAEFYRGAFYFGNLAGKHLRCITFADDHRTVRTDEALFADEFGRIRSVVARAASLYFTTSNRDSRGSPASDDDRILRWTPRACRCNEGKRSWRPPVRRDTDGGRPFPDDTLTRSPLSER
ncbi:PQQ-dependent sugar dehydrogenase [Halomarina halobia]|uniref:PQQ-dependent sugar dehydrogenase n=1 Tax=Halomarina halobia TaxID=3033386 RepID=A0ABD6A580_9EURY|nr:PQQ-dependent sugar dehydrogenase [Halomarina sp. PSR21]